VGKRGPAFEHVLHRLGNFIAARQLGALLAHPAFQIRDQWRTELLPDSAALLGTLVIDRAFFCGGGNRMRKFRRDQVCGAIAY
jgi:hypothetical protein